MSRCLSAVQQKISVLETVATNEHENGVGTCFDALLGKHGQKSIVVTMLRSLSVTF